ncbi:MAG: Na+/H+ antiporter NhaA [Planctomycetales bacterium]|nr:Na+/H+ antiporter NhaA [bacterium]UNM07485.1 MAG: Na+/H+ antiporter NhaA [Planctomycetales bacterium]
MNDLDSRIDRHKGQLEKIRERVETQFQSFVRLESSGGIVLLGCAIIALIWANSPWGDTYYHLWKTKLAFKFGTFEMSHPLYHWINDGLMALFFFLVGLEIKREVLVGELNTVRKAMLPIFAAVGGMLLPALIYAFANRGTEFMDGWGIPMATDIAFALAIMAMLGKRVPLALKVFLTAVAIVDDLGAVLVIAFFYSGNLAVNMLLAAAGGLALAFIFNAAGVKRPLPYAIVGLVVWYFVHESGIHATIAGVLVAMAIPAGSSMRLNEFIERCRRLLTRMEQDTPHDSHHGNDYVVSIENACTDVEPPLLRMEHALQPWIAYLIMPLFALANAGVVLSGDALSSLGHTVAIGIGGGLLVGKLIGVASFTWLAVRLGVAELPQNVGWKQIGGVAMLCGVGFTMSLFIANLAFKDEALLATAKMGILCASLVAGVAGYLLLARTGQTAEQRAAA